MGPLKLVTSVQQNHKYLHKTNTMNQGKKANTPITRAGFETTSQMIRKISIN